MQAGERSFIEAALRDTQSGWGSSRWGEKQRCEVGYDLRYNKGVRELERKSYFELGSLVHSVLHYVQAAVLREVEVDWHDVLEVGAELGRDFELLDETSRIMTAYWRCWGIENAGWGERVKIVQVEKRREDRDTFAKPISCRLDSLLERDGKLIIADHKTRSSRVRPTYRGVDDNEAAREAYRQIWDESDAPLDTFGEDFEGKGLDKADSWATRFQFVSSSWLVRKQLGLDYAPAVLVNILVKTKTPTFDRILVDFSNEELDRWEEEHRKLAARPDPLLPVMNHSQCAPEIGERCWAFGYCHGDKSNYEVRTPEEITE